LNTAFYRLHCSGSQKNNMRLSQWMAPHKGALQMIVVALSLNVSSIIWKRSFLKICRHRVA
ncbi:MAG: hypothetical protein WAM85_17480, partial [Terracidiphilus sp.]